MQFLSMLLLAGSALAAPRPAQSSAHQPRSDSIDDMLPPIVPINTRSGDRDLITKIMTAPTQAERVKLLNQPGDYVFDFKAVSATGAGESVGKGGKSVSATALTMPALIGNGASMTVAFLGPCGMNTAHVHNRATELNIVVKGRLVTNFVIENGAKPIANTMDTFQMSVFPQGAIHQEFNPDCEDSVFVAAFDNVDPGVTQVAQSFFALNGDVVEATLGGVPTFNGEDIETFRDHIPHNIALGIEACLNKCGIKRNSKRDISELLN
ncbi:RmlC-like cupin domain-containing protein [Fusarium tricinctum]|uniref:RmlC-like cupin domain-containing protein n=1 Tax=Fusarium tricinctum TaxID=61284 RepID=A0A8K0WBA6_9HYPO|nr:RmlC-like cupin domain-containing protein [Fusarium tricinctum]